MAGERPAAKAPFTADIQALGRRRQLAQAAGDVARVHDNLGGRRPIAGRDRDAPVSSGRQALVERDVEQAAGVGRRVDRAGVARHPHRHAGHPDPSGAPTVPMSPPRESPTTVIAGAGGRDENSRSSDSATSGPSTRSTATSSVPSAYVAGGTATRTVVTVPGASSVGD